MQSPHLSFSHPLGLARPLPLLPLIHNRVNNDWNASKAISTMLHEQHCPSAHLTPHSPVEWLRSSTQRHRFYHLSEVTQLVAKFFLWV
jgi:hypothetical protein